MTLDSHVVTQMFGDVLRKQYEFLAKTPLIEASSSKKVLLASTEPFQT